MTRKRSKRRIYATPAQDRLVRIMRERGVQPTGAEVADLLGVSLGSAAELVLRLVACRAVTRVRVRGRGAPLALVLVGDVPRRRDLVGASGGAE